MPRSTFSTGFLRGASGGLGTLASAIAGADRHGRAAYDNELTAQSRIGQAIASAQANQARASQDDAETAVLNRRPDVFVESVAGRTGTTIPAVNATRDYLRTGVMPERELPGPADEMGNGPGSAPMVSPEQLSAISREISRLAPALLGNIKDNKADDLAQAEKTYRDMDLQRQAVEGAMPADQTGRAMALLKATPLFKIPEGYTGNQFTGGIDIQAPVNATRQGYIGAQTQERKAAAAENYAQAGAARATADLRRQQSAAVGQGGGKAPSGYRWAINQDSGEPQLEPIPGGPKDPSSQTGKPLPAAAAKGLLENQTNLRRAQAAIKLMQGETVGDAAGDPNATGWKGFLPTPVLQRVDPSGVATRAAIADLGSLVLHDRSGAAVTAAEMPRLAPFIPAATDDPATVRKKLAQFVRNYQDEVGQQIDFYKASGYNVPADTLRDAPSDTPKQSQGAAKPVKRFNPATGRIE